MNTIKIALPTGALVFSAGAASGQSLEGTARTFFTTSSGVSNNSANRSCTSVPCANVVVAVAEPTPAPAPAPVKKKSGKKH